uniref:Uncharacterized protein n=1 Tax=Arion vulgaris TaxID=1028688 RepID=A0A0B7ABJ9_9EUPU
MRWRWVLNVDKHINAVCMVEKEREKMYQTTSFWYSKQKNNKMAAALEDGAYMDLFNVRECCSEELNLTVVISGMLHQVGDHFHVANIADEKNYKRKTAFSCVMVRFDNF